MSIDTADVHDLYRRPDGSVFKVIARCDMPTIKMKNLETGQEISGGINGIMWDGFEKLVPLSEANTERKK